MKFKIKTNNALIILCTLLISITAFAQATQRPQVGSTLELEECIDIALENNFGLLLRKENLTKSGASRLGAWSRLMPSANVRYSWSHSGQDRYNFTETGYTISNDHYSMGFSASQPIFAGGNNLLSLKTSYLNYRSAELDLTSEQSDLVYKIKQAFFAAISADQSMNNAARSFERINEQWRFVAQRDTLGLADPTEVSQMKVTLAENELSLLQAQNARRQSIENLLALLAVPLDTDVELIEPALLTPREKDIDYLLENAMKTNSQIRSAELSQQTAKLTKFSSWSDYLPSVNASYSYSWSDNSMPANFSQITDDATWSFGVSASWSLFTGTSRISSLISANSGERSAELGLLQAKQIVETSVRKAFRDMEEASARRRLAEVRVEDAEFNATLFREKFAIGNCTVLELLQAELSLQNAYAEKVRAVFDFRMSLAELERLSGVEMEN